MSVTHTRVMYMGCQLFVASDRYFLAAAPSVSHHEQGASEVSVLLSAEHVYVRPCFVACIWLIDQAMPQASIILLK